MAMMLAKTAGPLGVDVRDMQVEVQQDYDMGPPMRLKTVNVRFCLSKSITSEQEKALRAGAELCPVHTALRPDVPVKLELVSVR
jgi:uncharacterized OsmC-like protein